MLSGKRFGGSVILIMLLLSSCLFVTGCMKNTPRSELLSLSDKAVFYDYSGDNILSLRSVIVDSEGQDNHIIFEFDGDSEYLTQKVTESIIAKEYRYNNTIKGESEEQEINTKVEAIYDYGTVFILLNFDPNTECNHLYIIYDYFIEVRGPWDDPLIFVTRYSVNKDGAEGDIIYTQTYDKDREKWNECEEGFYEYPPPALD